MDVGKIELATSVLGRRIELPLVLAPCGLTRPIHQAGEIASARAAHRAGTVYTPSTMATTSIDALADATRGPLWYQIYVSRDRGLLEASLERARQRGHRAGADPDGLSLGAGARRLVAARSPRG